MNPLRHLLLVAVVLFAQLAAGAHAIGHAEDRDGLPTHACELCLAAHDLGAALPSLATLLPPCLPKLIPATDQVTGRCAFPPPAAPQRGPPSA